jgi:hypothetical protein
MGIAVADGGKPIVILTTMVRNESQALPRLLASAARIVTHVALTDTGSDDDTIAVAEAHCSALGLSLTVHRTRFIDFASSRNESLETGRLLARSLGEQRCHLLLLDADMEVPADVAPAPALPDVGMLPQQCGGYCWWNIRTLRADVDAAYVGRTHEYLRVAGGRQQTLNWFTIIDHADGGCRHDKFERDERLLRLDLAEQRSSRTLYYLAQTLKDLGRRAEAVACYDERAALGDFPEEGWHARLQASRCCEGAEADMRALEAWCIRPWRAEPLADIAQRASDQGRHALALGMVGLGKPIPMPTGELMVLEEAAYRWTFACVEMVSAYYTGEPERGRAACEYLQFTPGSPQAALARANAVYYSRPIGSKRRSSAALSSRCRSFRLAAAADGRWLALVEEETATGERSWSVTALDADLRPLEQGRTLEPGPAHGQSRQVAFSIPGGDLLRGLVLATDGDLRGWWQLDWSAASGRLLAACPLGMADPEAPDWVPAGAGSYLAGLAPWTLRSPQGTVSGQHTLALNLSGLIAATALVRWRDGWLLVARQPVPSGAAQAANLYRLVHVESMDGDGLSISPPFHLGDSTAADECHSLSITAGGSVLAARVAGKPCVLTLSDAEMASWLDQGTRDGDRQIAALDLSLPTTTAAAADRARPGTPG